jgi:predicted ribosomally synthesized peptide with SipW-like signal peptide
MKKILLSLAMVGVAGVIAAGATSAYFSDPEISSGNTFTAETLDLKIDNSCTYNGAACIGGENGYFWEGTEVPCTCAWAPMDTGGKAIFDLQNVAPNDQGEDSISFHVDDSPAWVCAELSNITKKENGCNSPEAKVDETCEETAVDTGELPENVYFSAWRDIGAGANACNNKKDSDETYLFQNMNLNTVKWPVADASTGAGPINNSCVGIAWNIPSEVNNIIQSDSFHADILFSAYQAKNNENFVCFKPTVNIVKNVVNNNGGQATASQFDLFLGGNQVVNGQAQEFAPGTYAVTESGPAGYASSFSGDCNAQGQLTIEAGKSYTCTITNDDIPATLKIVKAVSGGTKVPNDFNLKIDGNLVQNNVAVNVTPGSHTASETNLPNYTASAWGGNCASNGTVSINLGENKICTITNTYVPPVTGFVNGGFENSNFNGWSVSGGASVVSSYSANPSGTLFYPKDGSRFALLVSGGPGAGAYNTISQSVTLNAGQQIRGWAAFDTTDYMPYNDDAAAVVVKNSVSTTVWSRSVSGVGSYGESPWAQWAFTAPSSGTYTLELKVRNNGDDGVPSYALFDANVVL